jgi:hypothetical protein
MVNARIANKMRSAKYRRYLPLKKKTGTRIFIFV